MFSTDSIPAPHYEYNPDETEFALVCDIVLIKFHEIIMGVIRPNPNQSLTSSVQTESALLFVFPLMAVNSSLLLYSKVYVSLNFKLRYRQI